MMGTITSAATWVSPPPFDSGIQEEPRQEDCRRIRAGHGLLSFSSECPTPYHHGHPPFCARQEGHDNEGGGGEHDSDDALLGPERATSTCGQPRKYTSSSFAPSLIGQTYGLNLLWRYQGSWKGRRSCTQFALKGVTRCDEPLAQAADQLLGPPSAATC